MVENVNMAKQHVVIIALLVSVYFTSLSGCSAYELSGEVYMSYDKIYLVKTTEGELRGAKILPGISLVNVTNYNFVGTGEKVVFRGGKVREDMLLVNELIAEKAVKRNEEVSIHSSEIARLLSAGGPFVIIDTRAQKEFRKGHIPSALSMPSFDLKKLPRGKDSVLIFYSQGKRDTSALESFKRAVAADYGKARLFREGLQAWADKYPLEIYLEDVGMALGGNDYIYVDARPEEDYLREHIAGAVSLPAKEASEDLLWQYSPRTVIFYGMDDDDDSAYSAADTAYKYGQVSRTPLMLLRGGLVAWKKAGLSLEKGPANRTIDRPGEVVLMDELRELWDNKGGDTVMVYVARARANVSALDFLLKIPIDDFPSRICEIPRDRDVVLLCTSGYRSRIGYHILRNAGYENVRFVAMPVPISMDGKLK